MLSTNLASGFGNCLNGKNEKPGYFYFCCLLTIFPYLSWGPNLSKVESGSGVYLLSCGNIVQKSRGADESLETIAAIGSNDLEVRDIISEELGRGDIDCCFTGTVVHDVRVFAKDAQRAREILRNSKRLKGKWIHIRNANGTF